MAIPSHSIRREPFHHGFYEVFLPVTDVDRAVSFYVKKLGFSVGRRESPSSALLLYDDHGTRSMLGLFQVEAVERRYHISFRVFEKDVDRMMSFLVERGIEPVHPSRARVQGPMREPIVHGWMPAASVFFTDPDGHLLELIADLAGERRPEVLYCPLSEWRSTVDRSTS
jgi:catechol 2,3-dioxygenase-like lactoylglutathione lyase family enzyme